MIKNLLKKAFRLTGHELRKIKSKFNYPGSCHRPVGGMVYLIEDLKARGLKCENILDVGANRTNWSIDVQKIYPSASFYLIEPQIEMEPHLNEFCDKYKGSSYYLVGAGAENKTLTFTVWDDLAGSSFLPSPRSELLQSKKQRELEIITIDSLIKSSEIKIPELIKLDIQGFELEALKGASKTFGITEVYILEVSFYPFADVPGIPVFAEVINFMLERDYVVYDFPGFSRRPSDGALGQCDVCFVKKNSFLRKSNNWA
jgi:FkbM family methyltransferase